MPDVGPVLPLLSIVWGNLAAMRQARLRRMVAYSSIADTGYLCCALLGAPAGRLQATVLLLLAPGWILADAESGGQPVDRSELEARSRQAPHHTPANRAPRPLRAPSPA